MKLCAGVIGVTLMVTTLKKLFTSWLPTAGGHFGVFWDLFLHMYIFFLDIRLIFCHEILHTNTKKIFDTMSRSSEGHFGAFWSLFWHTTSTF